MKFFFLRNQYFLRSEDLSPFTKKLKNQRMQRVVAQPVYGRIKRRVRRNSTAQSFWRHLNKAEEAWDEWKGDGPFLLGSKSASFVPLCSCKLCKSWKISDRKKERNAGLFPYLTSEHFAFEKRVKWSIIFMSGDGSSAETPRNKKRKNLAHKSCH